jgi:hypothetical protein
MTATINSSEWSSISRVTVKKGDNFIITGTSSSGETLVITIFGTDEGTYSLSSDTASSVAVQCEAVYKETTSTSNSDAYVAYSGQVDLNDISSDNKRITGEFEFSLQKGLDTSDRVEITAGEFTNIKYTVTDSD